VLLGSPNVISLTRPRFSTAYRRRVCLGILRAAGLLPSAIWRRDFNAFIEPKAPSCDTAGRLRVKSALLNDVANVWGHDVINGASACE